MDSEIPDETPSRLLTLQDLAAALGLHESHVRPLLRNGVIPAMRLGDRGAWRIRPADLESYIESQVLEGTAARRAAAAQATSGVASRVTRSSRRQVAA